MQPSAALTGSCRRFFQRITCTVCDMFTAVLKVTLSDPDRFGGAQICSKPTDPVVVQMILDQSVTPPAAGDTEHRGIKDERGDS